MFGDAVLARLDRIWPNDALQAEPGASPGSADAAPAGSILPKTVSVISGGREGSNRPWVVLVSRRPAAPASAEAAAAPAPEITVEAGSGAISHATWISLAAACCSGLILYSLKHRTTVMDAQIGRVFRATKAAQDSTAILKVEWAALNEPTRLQAMAAQYSTLKPLVPTQFVALGDLAKHLPAPGTIIPDPPQPAAPVVTAARSAAAAPSAPATDEVVASAPAPAAPAPAAKAAVETMPVQVAAAAPPAETMQAAAPPVVEAAPPASPPPAEATPPATAPVTETAPSVTPPSVEAALPPADAAPQAPPLPAEAAPAPHVATPDIATAPTAPVRTATLPVRRGARPALPPRGPVRPTMLARIRPPALIAPPKLPSLMMLAAIAPPRIRLSPAAAAHAKPDLAHGHGAPAPLLHLAMARQPPRHDVTLAEFMAQIDAAKPAARRPPPPRHAGVARSEPAHTLSVPPPRPDILVARSAPPRSVETPAASADSASGDGTGDHALAAQPRQEEAEAQPRYQVPAYRYPPYQMPYGSPYSPVYRSPWGAYAWSSRPYYAQQPPQAGYVYQ